MIRRAQDSLAPGEDNQRKRWVEQVTTSTAGLSSSEAWSVAMDRSAWMALRPIDGQAYEKKKLIALFMI